MKSSNNVDGDINCDSTEANSNAVGFTLGFLILCENYLAVDMNLRNVVRNSYSFSLTCL